MTTLVASRRPLEVLSMSNQAERRPTKRTAGTPSRPGALRLPTDFDDLLTFHVATADYERDDDFQFVRKSKRPKTEEVAAEPVKRSTRGRRRRHPRRTTMCSLRRRAQQVGGSRQGGKRARTRQLKNRNPRPLEREPEGVRGRRRTRTMTQHPPHMSMLRRPEQMAQHQHASRQVRRARQRDRRELRPRIYQHIKSRLLRHPKSLCQ